MSWRVQLRTAHGKPSPIRLITGPTEATRMLCILGTPLIAPAAGLTIHPRTIVRQWKLTKVETPINEAIAAAVAVI